MRSRPTRAFPWREPTISGSLGDFLTSSQELYRTAMWHDLPVWVEIWLENALAGFVHEVTAPWDVPLMMMRGFPPASFVDEAMQAIEEARKSIYVYRFEDYDPSGMAISDTVNGMMAAWTTLVTFAHGSAHL